MSDHRPIPPFKNGTQLDPGSLFSSPDVPDPFSISRDSRPPVGRDGAGHHSHSAALNRDSCSANPPDSTVASTFAQKKQPFLCQPDEVLEDESEYLVVYTDGACALNGYPGARAGSGVWFGRGQNRSNLAERCPGPQTNNRAELFALIRALETIEDCKRPILLKTDSAYAINCIRTYLPHWRRAGFKSSSGGGFVRNWRLIRYLGALVDYRRLVLGQPVKLFHVFGHRGQEGNEAADRLAKVGSLAEKEFEPDWLAQAEVLEVCIEGLAARRSQVHPHAGRV